MWVGAWWLWGGAVAVGWAGAEDTVRSVLYAYAARHSQTPPTPSSGPPPSASPPLRFDPLPTRSQPPSLSQPLEDLGVDEDLQWPRTEVERSEEAPTLVPMVVLGGTAEAAGGGQVAGASEQELGLAVVGALLAAALAATLGLLLYQHYRHRRSGSYTLPQLSLSEPPRHRRLRPTPPSTGAPSPRLFPLPPPEAPLGLASVRAGASQSRPSALIAPVPSLPDTPSPSLAEETDATASPFWSTGRKDSTASSGRSTGSLDSVEGKDGTLVTTTGKADGERLETGEVTGEGKAASPRSLMEAVLKELRAKLPPGSPSDWESEPRSPVRPHHDPSPRQPSPVTARNTLFHFPH